VSVTPPQIHSFIHSFRKQLIKKTEVSSKLEKMLLDAILMALFLPCLGMAAIFIIYMCLLWYATTHPTAAATAVILKPVMNTGLSPSELQKIPCIVGKELVTGPECAVCLDDIGEQESARVIPGCNHSFHKECADTWLSKHPVCPVCRAKLDDHPNASSQNPC
jgi:E3 ubiquitin-protein ligase ATL23